VCCTAVLSISRIAHFFRRSMRKTSKFLVRAVRRPVSFDSGSNRSEQLRRASAILIRGEFRRAALDTASHFVQL
jgi:hypothetical protein